jgi:hypothetical protein
VWTEMWMLAESIDLTLEQVHQTSGYSGVCKALELDDRLEHWLSRIGAEVAFTQTGDVAMRKELSTSKPPGEGHLLPEWAVAAARDTTKALFQQAGRQKGGRGKGRGKGAEYGDGDDDAGAGRRPRRRGNSAASPAAGPPATAGAAGGAGHGGGGK